MSRESALSVLSEIESKPATRVGALEGGGRAQRATAPHASIGQLWGIFSLSDSLLVSCGEYSQCLTVYWSAVGNILSA